MEFILATTITCSQLRSILHRLDKKLDLTLSQKIEVARELTTYVKSCPITIKKD